MDSTPSTPGRPLHSSMEGGLDDYSLLQIGSPKVEEDKENCEKHGHEFNPPRVPSPKKQPKYLDTGTIMTNSIQ